MRDRPALEEGRHIEEDKVLPLQLEQEEREQDHELLERFQAQAGESEVREMTDLMFYMMLGGTAVGMLVVGWLLGTDYGFREGISFAKQNMVQLGWCFR